MAPHRLSNTYTHIHFTYMGVFFSSSMHLHSTLLNCLGMGMCVYMFALMFFIEFQYNSLDWSGFAHINSFSTFYYRFNRFNHFEWKIHWLYYSSFDWWNFIWILVDFLRHLNYECGMSLRIQAYIENQQRQCFFVCFV